MREKIKMLSLRRVLYGIKLFGLSPIGEGIIFTIVQTDYMINRFTQVSSAAKDMSLLEKKINKADKEWDQQLKKSRKTQKDDRAWAKLANRNAYSITYIQLLSGRAKLDSNLPECKVEKERQTTAKSTISNGEPPR